MSDPTANASERSVTPKRPRGRPRGTFKVRPDADSRQEHAGILDELLTLSPIEGLIDRVQVPNKRFTPSAFHAMREALLIDLMKDFPEEAAAFVEEIKKRPAAYTPQQI